MVRSQLPSRMKRPSAERSRPPGLISLRMTGEGKVSDFGSRKSPAWCSSMRTVTARVCAFVSDQERNRESERVVGEALHTRQHVALPSRQGLTSASPRLSASRRAGRKLAWCDLLELPFLPPPERTGEKQSRFVSANGRDRPSAFSRRCAITAVALDVSTRAPCKLGIGGKNASSASGVRRTRIDELSSPAC